MIRKLALNEELSRKGVSVVFSKLTSALQNIDDFEHFVSSLESSVGKLPFFDNAVLEMTRVKGEDAVRSSLFEEPCLALPLTGRNEVHGVLKIGNSERNRSFGAEDLHLMGSLAMFTAALVDNAVAHGNYRENLEVLRFLFDLVPVGVVCFSGAGEIVLVNKKAGQYLDGKKFSGLDDCLRHFRREKPVGSNGKSTGSYYLDTDSTLISAEIRQLGDDESSPRATAILMTDLTSEEAALQDVLAREVYRCQWMGLKLTYALLESVDDKKQLFAILPDIKANLSAVDVCGVVDADHLGIILPEKSMGEGLQFLRSLGPLLSGHKIRIGMASLLSEKSSPEELVSQAMGSLMDGSRFFQRSLLLHDDYQAVNDMLDLFLRRDFQIIKSEKIETSLQLLSERPFDGIVTELDLSGGQSGADLILKAKEMQPLIRPFITTARVQVGKDLGGIKDEVKVFRKPFDVKLMQTQIKESISSQ